MIAFLDELELSVSHIFESIGVGKGKGIVLNKLAHKLLMDHFKVNFPRDSGEHKN